MNRGGNVGRSNAKWAPLGGYFRMGGAEGKVWMRFSLGDRWSGLVGAPAEAGIPVEEAGKKIGCFSRNYKFFDKP
jgi:hypothetical protein